MLAASVEACESSIASTALPDLQAAGSRHGATPTSLLRGRLCAAAVPFTGARVLGPLCGALVSTRLPSITRIAWVSVTAVPEEEVTVFHGIHQVLMRGNAPWIIGFCFLRTPTMVFMRIKGEKCFNSARNSHNRA